MIFQLPLNPTDYPRVISSRGSWAEEDANWIEADVLWQRFLHSVQNATVVVFV
jgi:hypothetical protein